MTELERYCLQDAKLTYDLDKMLAAEMRHRRDAHRRRVQAVRQAADLAVADGLVAEISEYELEAMGFPLTFRTCK